MRKVMLYMGILMVLVYLSLGVILMGGYTRLNIPELYVRLLGIIITLYGIFRGYRIYQNYFKD